MKMTNLLPQLLNNLVLLAPAGISLLFKVLILGPLLSKGSLHLVYLNEWRGILQLIISEKKGGYE